MYKSNLLDVIAAKKIVGGGSGGGGGDNVLNENGVIKQEHLPAGFPYKTAEYIVNPTNVSISGTAGDIREDVYSLLTAGNTYTISWNGTDYDCVAEYQLFVEDETDTIVMEKDGVFLLRAFKPNAFPASAPMFAVIPQDGSASVTLSVYVGGVTKIAKEYLPDGYPYDNRVIDFVMEEETLLGPDDGAFGSLTVVSMTVGETYIVSWNGTDYECAAQALIEDNTQVGVVVGNLGAMTGGVDTGEPFLIIAVLPEFVEAMGGMGISAIAFDGSTSVTVSIGQIEGTLDIIDPKWLPEGYPYKEKARTILNESTAEPDENGAFAFQIDHPIVSGRKYIVTQNGETNTYTAQSFGSVGAMVGGWLHLYDSGGVSNDSLTNLQSVTLSIVEAEDTVTPMWSGYLPFAVAYITEDAETGEYSCADMTYEEARRALESGRFLNVYCISQDEEATFTHTFGKVSLSMNPSVITLYPATSYDPVLLWDADGIVADDTGGK